MNKTQERKWLRKVWMTGLWATVLAVMLPALQAGATQVWSGTRVSFVKTNSADWTLAVNQDHITTNVWLTRKNSQGLFNIAQEAGYTNPGPADTEWAYGTTADLPLTFQSWTNWNGNNPTSAIGQDAVLHIISQDIYIDFKLTSWTGGAGGGGFSYERAIGPRVWNGDRITFSKGDYANWGTPSNQDRITQNVWLTRENDQGLFNIKTESDFSSYYSPEDTEWSYGSTSNLESLSFTDWNTWARSLGDTPSIIGGDAVLHLISDDIYIDIKFSSWTSGGDGGGFAYSRAKAPVVVTLNSNRTTFVVQGQPFVDPGATAATSNGTPLSVTTAGTVDTNSLGDYTITYAAFDGLGNVGVAQRTVKVVTTAPTIWSQMGVSFSKPDYADWTLPENQDQITPTVSITRQNDQGLFNIMNESSFSSYYSPEDTEWAYGTTDDLESLSFTDWNTWARSRGDTPSIIGGEAVVHLISEDIYIDIKFSSWTSGGDGGGFSYERAGIVFVNLVGSPSISVLQGEPFVDPGVSAVDIFGNPLSVVTNGTVDTSTPGTYVVTYSASDTNGYTATAKRYVGVVTQSPKIWDGPTATFTKADYADWSLPANQDRITPGVWITRADDQGLFNFNLEAGFDSGTSPADTEWAYGSISNIWSLTFMDFRSWARSRGDTPTIISQDAVVHLISEDIYIPIKFLSWTSGGNGGGFSYQRAMSPAVITLNGPALKYVLLGGSFADPGASAMDPYSNSLPVTVTGSVDFNTAADYLLTYSANVADYTTTVSRTVRVVTNAPLPKAAMMPSYAQKVTYANAVLNEPIMVWGRAWEGVPPFAYSIDFGDGTPAATGTVENASFIGAEHSYTSGGSKTAVITFTDDWGQSLTRQSVIKVVPTATHEQRINIAIEKGLIWLYSNQKTKDTNRIYWRGEDEHGIGATGGALLALQENGHMSANDYEQDIYAETVQKGLNWLVDNSNVSYYDITSQHSDGIAVRDCDSNGNGQGIYFYHDTYGSAYAAIALILSQPNAAAASNTFVTSGPFAGRSYYEVIQDAFDQFSYAQGDNSYRGGWQYAINGTGAWSFDGSAQQWPCLSFLAAQEKWGLGPQQWVIDNAIWAFEQLQDPVTGGVGYSSSSSWQNIAKCGGFMTASRLAGRSVTNDIGVQKALTFIGNNWYSGPGDTPGGWAGEFYAMYGSKKGMMFQGIETVSTSSGERNWYNDMSAWLLGNKEGSTPAGMPYIPSDLRTSYQVPAYTFGQDTDGSWHTSEWPMDGKELGTAHAILILTKAVTKPLPVAVIAPVGEQSDNATPFDMDGSGSYHQDSANSIVEYLWDWDASNGVDWNNPDATGARPTNPGYSTPGTNTVTLRVKDASIPANTSVATLEVIVTSGDVAPVAVAVPPGIPAYAGQVGGLITLDGSASYDPNGDTITNYVWDLNGNGIYGDGPDISSTNPTASVVFSNAYVGAIGLRVTANGKSGTSVSQVEIFASLNDLGVVSILATNLVPDVSADLQVVLLNNAASASDFSNVVVRFYNGNPLLSGSQISNNFTVILPKGVPVPLNVTLGGLAGIAPSNIHVYVDANMAIPEWNETNNVARALTEAPPVPSLAPPVMLYPVNITASNMLARWQGVTGAEAYELDVALDTNFVTHIPGYAALNTALAQQYTVTGLTSGVWYALRVRAWNTSSGYSDWSNVIWVPAGNNTPYEIHPPIGGPVSDGAIMERVLTNLFRGTGLVYSAESSNTNVATVAVTPDGKLTIDPHDPGVATITVRATDPQTGYTTSFSFVITVIGPPQLLSGVFRHELWNPRFEQLLTVTNTSGLNATGVRLVFTNLMPGITIENRTGSFRDGRPMIEMETAFTNGQALSLSVVYVCTGQYPVDQYPPTVEFQYILPAWQPPLDAAQLQVNGWVMPDGSNRIILEFDTIVGALYAVEYMNNFPDGTWIQVPLSLRAGANRTQWIDSGPPATQPMEGVRVYRIKQLAD